MLLIDKLEKYFVAVANDSTLCTIHSHAIESFLLVEIEMRLRTGVAVEKRERMSAVIGYDGPFMLKLRHILPHT